MTLISISVLFLVNLNGIGGEAISVASVVVVGRTGVVHITKVRGVARIRRTLPPIAALAVYSQGQ